MCSVLSLAFWTKALESDIQALGDLLQFKFNKIEFYDNRSFFDLSEKQVKYLLEQRKEASLIASVISLLSKINDAYIDESAKSSEIITELNENLIITQKELIQCKKRIRILIELMTL